MIKKSLIAGIIALLFVNGAIAAPCGTTGQIQTNGGSGRCAAINAPSSAVVGTADAQTLTNKILSGAANTLSNLFNLTTTGSGSASYNGSTNTLNIPVTSGGGTPGGTSGQVQYNNAGVFGGLSNISLTALINSFTSSLSGAVPASSGGTTNFLRADGTWAVPPGGSSSVPVTTVATSGSAQTISFPSSGSSAYDITLTANCTITLTGGTASQYQTVTLIMRQNSTAGWLPTLPTGIHWPGGIAPTPNTTAGKIDVFTLTTSDGGTTIFGNY